MKHYYKITKEMPLNETLLVVALQIWTTKYKGLLNLYKYFVKNFTCKWLPTTQAHNQIVGLTKRIKAKQQN